MNDVINKYWKSEYPYKVGDVFKLNGEKRYITGAWSSKVKVLCYRCHKKPAEYAMFCSIECAAQEGIDQVGATGEWYCFKCKDWTDYCEIEWYEKKYRKCCKDCIHKEKKV